MVRGVEIERLLDGLTAAQTAAVTSTAQPLAILAGAGSGKTRVLTRRIAYRVAQGTAEAPRVVAVTFTRKAAGELRHRLGSLGLREGVAAGTFHSLALSQLRRYWNDRNQSEPSILDRKVRILAPLMGGRRLGPTVQPIDIASEIEWAKARGIAPDRYAAEAEAAARRTPIDVEAFAALFQRYEHEKKRRGLVDFDDLLWQAGTAMQDDPKFAAVTRWRFRHLFVDEFQDVNPVQFRLLQGWLGTDIDLCVVGDPNQAIYSWNGADPTLLTDFGQRFPSAEVVNLTDNFRSTPQILAVANAVLADGHAGRTSAELVAHAPDGPAPTVVSYGTDTEEAKGIARMVRSAHRPGRSWSSIAVLVRTNAQSVPICEALQAAGVPYRVRGDGGFLQQPEVRDAIAALRRLPAATPVRSAVSDLDEMLATGGGTDERRGNLEELIRLAHEYDGLESGGSVAGFLAWLSATVKAEAPDTTGDAVEVATFHRAKGLEWPTVIVAGLEKGLVPIGHATTPAGEAEERRLLYVALTRAEHSLTCTWAERRSFAGRPVPRTASPYLEPIDLTLRLMARGVAPSDLRAKIAAERDRLADLSRARRANQARKGMAGANADPDLLTALKEWRSGMARTAGMPAYLIFHDATLAALAEAQPHDEAALLRVPGVGPVKVERYGAQVMRVLKEHRAAS